jgi:hypothetical protein
MRFVSLRAFLIVVTLALTSELFVSAQNGRAPTLAERLQHHNIALTSSALDRWPRFRAPYFGALTWANERGWRLT